MGLEKNAKDGRWMPATEGEAVCTNDHVGHDDRDGGGDMMVTLATMVISETTKNVF